MLACRPKLVCEDRERRMVRPARLERATSWFVARRSIQLSYGRATNRPLSLTYGTAMSVDPRLTMSHLDHKATSPASVRCYVLDHQRHAHARRPIRAASPSRSCSKPTATTWRDARSCATIPKPSARRCRQQLDDAARAGDHHDRRHRHHLARFHLRGRLQSPRQAPRRIRRALPHVELSGDRAIGDAEPRVRRHRAGKDHRRRCRDRRTPCASA